MTLFSLGRPCPRFAKMRHNNDRFMVVKEEGKWLKKRLQLVFG
jgi:hypothetical protein